MSIHDGHRARLRDRFLQEGLEYFSDIQVLELLLFYAVPRRDTNPIAHALLDKFGSLSGVLDASVPALCQVEGVGENTAALISMLVPAARFYRMDRASRMRTLPTMASCIEYLEGFFFGIKQERAYLLCMDAKCGILKCPQVAHGDLNAANISIRKIVEEVMNTKAASVILCHNHPGGLAIPSNEDIMTTQRIFEALNAVEVTMVDHLIFAEEDCISMKQSGYFKF